MNDQWELKHDGMSASNGEVSVFIPSEEMSDLVDKPLYRKIDYIDRQRSASIINQFMQMMQSEEDYGNPSFRVNLIESIRCAMGAANQNRGGNRS